MFLKISKGAIARLSHSLRFCFLTANALAFALIVANRTGLSKCGARLKALLRGSTQAHSQILTFGGQIFVFTICFDKKLSGYNKIGGAPKH